MEQNLERQVKSIAKKNRRRRVWSKLLGIVMCLVVFCTTYALILPAITKETDVFCGLEAHTHEEACYEKTLICVAEEGIHTRGDNCYTVEDALICTLTESEGHTHTEACSGTEKQLSCGQTESEGHSHTDACVSSEKTLSCGQEEAAGHTHGSACYTSTLTCTLAEDETHSHSETCYSETLTCTAAETEGHSHTDACYSETVTYICGQAETAGHAHSDGCYTEVEAYICGQEERAPHTHSDSCYQETKTLTCTLEENVEHVHADECYEEKLICEEEEHEHSLECYSDPDADVETAANWEPTLPDQLTGEYAVDVLAVARSQLGYTESTENYIVTENGSTKGYTRYGAWYGVPYGDWCAMFVSFCLDYAGVEGVPLDCYCPTWIESFRAIDSYYSEADFIPASGDVIFFDWDGDNISDHVGLVSEFIPATEHSSAQVKTIEGNSADRVQYVTYDWSDSRIMGYGALPLQTFYCGYTGHVHDDCGGCELEEHIHSEACEEPIEETVVYSLYDTGTLMYHHPDYLEYQYSSHRVNNFMTLTYVLIPYSDNMDEWEPSTLNWTANSGANYVVTYCADRNTDISESGELYTAYNILDTSYYSAYAEVLSGIVGHAYPFITADEMKAELASAYQAGETTTDLSCCTESEFIAAAQWAIWDMTGLSGTQTTATESTFPEYNAGALNPLTNVGHTESATIQNHVKAIRDWLVTQRAPSNLEIADDASVITKNADGTYHIETTLTLDRPLEEREVVYVTFSGGDSTDTLEVSGKGVDQFTVELDGLTAEEVLNAQVQLDVTFEHMIVYVYDSGDYQDMISGQWGLDEYSLTYDIDVETTSVDVTKHWANDNIGADYIEVQLYADGEKYGEPIQLSVTNDWTYTWDELIKYNSDGTEIYYEVKEKLVPGYDSSVNRTEGGTRYLTTFEPAYSFEEGATYIICYDELEALNALGDEAGAGGSGLYWARNQNITAADTVSQSALWTATSVSSDGTNAYLRNNATGNYLSYDGSSYITLSASASAKAYFLYNHLYFLRGTTNQYLLYLDGGDGYTTNVWDDALLLSIYKYTQVGYSTADVSYLITNTKYEELTSISVEKQWTERTYGSHPDSVSVNLLKNGEPFGDTVVLSAENDWYYRWENLPLKIDDVEVVYTIEEVLIEDYTVEVDTTEEEDGTLKFLLTNTWTPEYVPLMLSKVDSANTGKYLPGAQFQLYLSAEAEDEGAEAIPNTDVFGIPTETITIGETGTAQIENMLIGGTYYLVETAAPDGYSMLKEPIVFTVDRDENGQALLNILSGSAWATGGSLNENGKLPLQVLNEQGYSLPETGGTGTHLFTVGGLLLMAAAMIFLMYRHKPHRKEEFTSS